MTQLSENDALAQSIGDMLLGAEARVGVVETTAGGLISARLLSIAGASRWFDRGVVAYTGTSKQDLVGIETEVLREQGSVSVPVVEELARLFRERSGLAYCVAESGMAGPQTGRRSAKPAGTSVIAVATPEGVKGEQFLFEGSRLQVMEQIAEKALEMLREALAKGDAAG
jgi:PncC family amidohydrolase